MMRGTIRIGQRAPPKESNATRELARKQSFKSQGLGSMKLAAAAEDSSPSKRRHQEEPTRQSAVSSPNEKGRKRRKRRRIPSKQEQDTYGNSVPGQPDEGKRMTGRPRPLDGMIVAVSTLGVKGQSHTQTEASYKAVSQLCQSLGASMSGQLHKRVSCLVCNEAAVQNATQRVRKAVKKKVPLVHVEWIVQCREQNMLVDLEPHRLDRMAVEVIQSRADASAVKTSLADERKEEKADDDDDDVLLACAWSEPVSLGCCCVCHENGDTNCPWCTDCIVNSSK